MTRDELLWQQQVMNVELYKHYLKLVVEFNVFFYAITGAVVSYYLSNAEQPMMRFALALPLLMSVMFAVFFFYCMTLVKPLGEDLAKVRKALELLTAPEASVLSIFLLISALLMIVVAIGLAAIILCQPFTSVA